MASNQEKPRFDWEEDTPVEGGYYDKIELLRDEQDEVMAFLPKLTEKSGDIPAAMEQVKDQANEIISIIRQRFVKHDDKENWLRLTYRAARTGMLGANPKTELALAEFDDVEQKLLIALRPKRRWYMTQLFFSFVCTVTSASLIYFLLNSLGLGANLHVFFGIPGLDLETWMAVINGQISTLYGLAIGILFSGIVQNRVISKQSLRHFDPDGFSTPERLLYVWVAATALEVLLWFNVVTIGVGNVSFNEISEKAWVGALIGLITALATEAIVSLTTQTAKTVKQQNS